MSKTKITYGVMGAGVFGSVIANLISQNHKALIFSQREDALKAINIHKQIKGIQIQNNITATDDPAYFTETCTVIFVLVRSKDFRSKIQNLSKFLTPAHILIHGIKGFDLKDLNLDNLQENKSIYRDDVFTMSDVIEQETVVKRIGCISGPNLAAEINKGELAATVIASKFNEVIAIGKRALSAPNFKVFSNPDIKAVELTGALKNIMAIAAGAIDGLGYGYNAKALLISRGLSEMIWIGKTMGYSPNAFLGLAGIGDLIATCSSPTSRNFTLGYQIATEDTDFKKQEDYSKEVVEGVRTIQIINALAKTYTFRAPITQTLYKIIFEKMPIKEGIDYLMHFPLHKDVDFLEG